MILTSSIMYASYGVWSRLMGTTFQPFYQAWIRSLITVLIMLPFMVAGKGFRKIDREDWGQLAIYIAFTVFTQVPIYYAFNHAPIGTVQLVFYSAFIITAYAVGRFYLGEKLTKVKYLAMGLTLAGLVTVFGVSALAFAPLGLALAALNGFASGGETAGSKRITEKYPPFLLVFWGWVATLFTHLPMSILLGEKQNAPRLDWPWVWLVAYSIVSTVGFWLAIVGFKFVDASIASLIGTTEVLFSALLGVLVFHQSLSWGVAIGGIMILAAAALPEALELYQARAQTPTIKVPAREEPAVSVAP